MSRSRTKVLENVKLTSFDDLFGGNKMEKTAEAGDVKEIPLSELHEFHNHPFQIRSDEELAEMIESVREHGVLVPGIVRKHKEGGYEIIAGHTRKHVCELLGFETMPVFVKEMDDDEASLVMVDSNIQRENIRPSEKAKAYKIKYDAMKNQGKAGNSLKMMSEESGENYKLIQRYIWLARLNDDLLALVDNKQLGMVQGVSLSVLQEKEQEAVYDAICRHKMKLSTVQANTIKQLSVDGKFNEQILERYLTSAQKQKRKKEITLKNERLSEYFEEETTEEEMMNIIFELLETWKRKKVHRMNKIILLGNMTRNPKTTRKTAEDGREVVITKFDLAVNRRSKRDGEADADFFHCTSFGRQAEFVERYFHSGSRVLVIGRVQNNNYTTKEGSKVYGFSIITEEVEFAQKKSAEKPANKDSDFSSVSDEEQPVNGR